MRHDEDPMEGMEEWVLRIASVTFMTLSMIGFAILIIKAILS